MNCRQKTVHLRGSPVNRRLSPFSDKRPRSMARRVPRLVGLFMFMTACVMWSITRAIMNRSEHGGEPRPDLAYTHYPKELFKTDWTKYVPLRDQLDLGRVHKACMQYKDSIISWNGDDLRLIDKKDSDLLNRLKQCAAVDIFIPSGIRNNGYCEDAAAYAKYLNGRMLPGWLEDFQVFDPSVGRVVHYLELCPRTPTIFFNHYNDNFLNETIWPATKKLFLMPNIEMYELQTEHYRRADVVLCKTAICARYVQKWFDQYGNPRGTKVIYTRHTSTNIAAIAHSTLPSHAATTKNFEDVSFVHTAGTSIQKGTSRIFDCWLKRPDLPHVHIYIAEGLYDDAFQEQYEHHLNGSANIHLHVGKLSEVEFGRLFVNSSFFLCPSIQEGYGHYINQARAAGGFVIAPDIPPMNELITPTSGVLIHARAGSSDEQFLGGSSKHPLGLRGVPGFIAEFGGDELCEAVDYALDGMSPPERQRAAERARQQYFFDLVFFARVMKTLREDRIHTVASGGGREYSLARRHLLRDHR